MCLWQQAMRRSFTAATLRPNANAHCLDFRTRRRICLLRDPTVQISLGVRKESSLERALTSLMDSHYRAEASLRCSRVTDSIFRYFLLESYSSAALSLRVLLRSSRSTILVIRQFFSLRFFISSWSQLMAMSNFLFSASTSPWRILSVSLSFLASSSWVLKLSSAQLKAFFILSLVSFSMRFSSTSALVRQLNFRQQLRMTSSCCSSFYWASWAFSLMCSMFFCYARSASTACSTAFPAFTTCYMLPLPNRYASSPGYRLVQRWGLVREREREDQSW